MDDEQEIAVEVNTEEIMRDICADILAKHATVGRGGQPLVGTSGEHLPPEIYEHLYQAALGAVASRIVCFQRETPFPDPGACI